MREPQRAGFCSVSAHPNPFGARHTLCLSLYSIPTAMRITAILLTASLLLLGSCTEKENASPRPPIIGQEDLTGQDFHFKVKAEEWETHGTPGDDLAGYMISKNVSILTDDIAQNGTVRVYVKRANNNFAELPIQAHQGAPGGVNWRFTHRAGSVQIFIDRNGETFTPPDQVMTFKVVVFGGQ